MSIVTLVQSVADTLTPSERMLVKEVMARPREIALSTAGELAERAGVHEATASRLARKLGFESYADFRDAIRDEFIVRTDPAVRMRNTLAHSRGNSILGGLIAQEIEALTALPDFIGDDRLKAAARQLTDRRKIFIFARGNAESLAVLMERRLRRMAIDAILLNGDSRDVAERLLALNADDALLAFAFRRQPRHYQAVIEHARKVGAFTLAIAGSIGPALAPAADMLLSAPRSGAPDGFQTLTVPMAICNGLILQLAETAERRSLVRLEELGRLISTFEDT
ncbi:MurR/RpiR family transcriptional regulator [Nordella sp. HKS 07]|uniref:MurR/RpiR family transcriptional regulator n=1 Tax=Nordella sp. HKS 07 TaxID=2712222 RepID=UPI0013E0F4A0|nr:MurR/RpiR family transcriptional regulator [Nordella sp. HKS 07]QIG50618.1 MurR/RpiR family transcriptional regulator [Nordella sp. HKS 07]